MSISLLTKNTLICILIVFLNFGLVDTAFSMRSMSRFAEELWLARIDTAGQILWSSSYAKGTSAIIKDVIVNQDSGFTVVAKIENPGDKRGSGRCWLIVTDGGGVIQSERCLDLDDAGYARNCSHLLQLSGGRYLLSGGSSVQRTAWLLCVTSMGDELWHVDYPITDRPAQIGCMGITYCDDGGFVICGTAGDSAKAQSSTLRTDSWVLKVDSCGIQQWLHFFGHDDLSVLESLAVTGDGQVVAAGWRCAGNLSEGFFHLQGWRIVMSPDGQLIQEQLLTEKQDSRLCTVQSTFDGGVVCGGYIGKQVVLSFGESPEVFLVEKLNKGGNVDWRRRYTHLDVTQMCVGNGNDFLLFGFEFPKIDSALCTFMKFDISGAAQWSRKYGLSSAGNPLIGRVCPGGYLLAGYRRVNPESNATGAPTRSQQITK